MDVNDVKSHGIISYPPIAGLPVCGCLCYSCVEEPVT